MRIDKASHIGAPLPYLSQRNKNSRKFKDSENKSHKKTENVCDKDRRNDCCASNGKFWWQARNVKSAQFLGLISSHRVRLHFVLEHV